MAKLHVFPHLRSALALSTLLVASCHGAPQKSSVKIVGGQHVASDDPVAASTVAILINVPQGVALCTGSLIDARHVVSAGHCLAEGADSETLAFGTTISPTPSLAQLAASYSVNPAFNLTNPTAIGSGPHGDISVLTLSEEAPAGYRPVPILPADQPLNEGEAITLAGYGMTSIDDQSTTHLLRSVTTNLVRSIPADKEFEVGDTPGRGACHGDSGGPAFVERDGQLYLIGVTSRDSDLSGTCEHNTIYTDVRGYQDWIAENTQN